MKISKGRILLGGILVLIGGLYLADRLFLNKRGLASSENGFLASRSENNYDLSEESGNTFLKRAKYALIEGLRVEKTSSHLGLSPGLFLVKNEEGAKVYACEKYPRLELVLQAEGVAYSGNIPTLRIQGPCVPSDDGRHMEAFAIPLKDLDKKLRENPNSSFPFGDHGESFGVSAQNLYNEWPTQWNLVGIKLFNNQEVLDVDGYEIISVLDQALTLDFSEVR